MAMHGVLVERNKKLYVKYSTPLYSEPKMRSMYWPVEQTKGNPYNAERPQAGDRAYSAMSDHPWSTSRDGYPNTGSVWTDPKKQAEIVEEEDIPCPKARGMETRWNDGRWEKLSKTKGWIPA